MVLNGAQPLVQAGLLGEAIDAGPALVFVADEEMRFLAVNEAACSALGYGREELLRLRVTDVADGPAVEEDYANMVATGEAVGRTELLRSDGSRLMFDYRASRVTVAQLTTYVSVGFVV